MRTNNITTYDKWLMKLKNNKVIAAILLVIPIVTYIVFLYKTCKSPDVVPKEKSVSNSQNIRGNGNNIYQAGGDISIDTDSETIPTK